AAPPPVLRLVDGLVGRLPELPEQDRRQQGLPRLRGPGPRWLWAQQRRRGVHLLAGARRGGSGAAHARGGEAAGLGLARGGASQQAWDRPGPVGDGLGCHAVCLWSWHAGLGLPFSLCLWYSASLS